MRLIGVGSFLLKNFKVLGYPSENIEKMVCVAVATSLYKMTPGNKKFAYKCLLKVQLWSKVFMYKQKTKRRQLMFEIRQLFVRKVYHQSCWFFNTS